VCAGRGECYNHKKAPYKSAKEHYISYKSAKEHYISAKEHLKYPQKRYVRLFCRYLGLFCRYVGPFFEKALFCNRDMWGFDMWGVLADI